jgi:hypothetical protein
LIAIAILAVATKAAFAFDCLVLPVAAGAGAATRRTMGLRRLAAVSKQAIQRVRSQLKMLEMALVRVKRQERTLKKQNCPWPAPFSVAEQHEAQEAGRPSATVSRLESRQTRQLQQQMKLK